MSKVASKSIPKNTSQKSNSNNTDDLKFFKCTEINDHNKVSFTPFSGGYDKRDGDKTTSVETTQCSSFVKYDDQPASFVTDNIIMDCHGFASLEYVEKWCKGEDPNYVKMPVHQSVPLPDANEKTKREIQRSNAAKKEFSAAVSIFDKAVNSKKGLDQMLLPGKSYILDDEEERSFIKFQPSIKKPSTKIQNKGKMSKEEIKKKEEQLKKYADRHFIKLKFHMVTNERNEKVYGTEFFRINPSLKKNDPDYRTQVHCKSYADLLELCPFGSTVRFLIQVRVWASKTVDEIKDRDGNVIDNTRDCGLTYTIRKMQVIPKIKSSSENAFKKFQFDNSSDEDEDIDDDEKNEEKNVTNDKHEESDSEGDEPEEGEPPAENDSEGENNGDGETAEIEEVEEIEESTSDNEVVDEEDPEEEEEEELPPPPPKSKGSGKATTKPVTTTPSKPAGKPTAMKNTRKK